VTRWLAALLAAVVLVRAAGATREADGTIVFAADRAPAVSGEIWRVDLGGGRLDLSRSPFQDTAPAVSTDGKRVAFLSDRAAPAGRYRVFEVGIDGRGLHAVSSFLYSGQAAQLAWSSRGELAVVVERSQNPFRMGLYLLDPEGRQRLALGAPKGIGLAWSPDGSVLLVADDVGVRAVSPSGRTLWAAAGRGFAWSARNLAAVSAADRIGIYHADGRRVASFPGRNFAWSADGSRIAVVLGNRVGVRTSEGRLILERSLPITGDDHGVTWVSRDRIAIGGRQLAGLDLRTGRSWQPTDAAFATRTPDGRVLRTSRNGRVLTLAVGGRTLVRVAGCLDDGTATGAENIQFTADGRSLVYQSYCPEAFDNLYSITGTTVSRLTDVPAQQMSPALSPDGTRLAYSAARATGLSCKGCPSSLWISDANGSHPRQLTHPGDCSFDDAPSWSPDGRSVLITRSGCAIPPNLVTVDVPTGAAHLLHVRGAGPAWGQTGIAYVDDVDVWTAAPDGGDRRRVGRGTSPTWSHDGLLAYLDGTTLVVGSRRVRLPFLSVTSLAWSPDGTNLTVAAHAPGTPTADVYTFRPDGSGIRRLTTDLGVSAVAWGSTR
jgi:Tol biopolymer transport system component